MKIALCQINPILGSFTYNKKLIEKNYNTALKNGATAGTLFETADANWAYVQIDVKF